MRAVDLRAVVEAAIEVVRPVAAMKSVTLQVELPPVSCPVRGDGDRLQQVLWNLLTNGIKFTPEGGSVHLSVANDGAVVTVRVRDTGVGMTEEFLPHVFERFRQADGSMTREHGGLGLGMAIARELTDLHGGTIEAASAGPGLGSDFIMTLPARSSTSMSHEPGVDEDTGSRVPSLRGVRVLAVDDNIDALDVLTTTLAAAGIHVSGACSGAEALSQWTVNHSDVLLCDLAMPHMDGYEVLRRIREIDAAAGRLTPAIAVTAHASEDQQARSVRAGFQQHVAKPYQPADLVRAVAASLEHR
jgi:CheY-like chemotaxis protein